MVKNRGICIFMQKNTKKATIRSNFAEFSRTRLWSESHGYGLKMFLEVLHVEFFSVLGFFKNEFQKKLSRIKKSLGKFCPPPLGKRGLKEEFHCLYGAITMLKYMCRLCVHTVIIFGRCQFRSLDDIKRCKQIQKNSNLNIE